MITKYHIETKKGEMEKIISQVRKNKKNNIYEDYAIACNQLTSFNQKNFVIILQNIINFNNNVSILHKKRNQIIYKLTLYLCMDLQNAIKKGKEIKAKAS
jgi:flagellar biosynthesis/type III secretory pathway chaperone